MISLHLVNIPNVTFLHSPPPSIHTVFPPVRRFVTFLSSSSFYSVLIASLVRIDVANRYRRKSLSSQRLVEVLMSC